MEYNLTKDQLAIVADRLNKLKSLEIESKSEKTRLEDFITGILTANGVTGGTAWEIKEEKLFTKDKE